MYGPWKVKVAQSCPLWPHGLYHPWNSASQNTGVGSLSLLQGIFPTQGSNPGLPHCGQIPYQLSQQAGPGILEWVAYLFSSGSSQPRNRTGVSCTAGEFFTSWTTRESSSLKNRVLRHRKMKTLSRSLRETRWSPWNEFKLLPAHKQSKNSFWNERMVSTFFTQSSQVDIVVRKLLWKSALLCL